MEKLILKLKKNQEISLLIFLSGLMVFAGSLLSPVESVYLEKISSSKKMIGFVFSFGTAMIFIFSLIFGRFLHRLSRKRLLIYGFLIGIIFPIVYASSQNLIQYIFGRSLWAFSGVTVGVMISVVFQNLLNGKSNIGELSGLKSSLGAISGALGAVLGGICSDHFGFRTTYVLVSLVYILVFIIFLLYIYPEKDKYFQKKDQDRPSFKKFWYDINHNPFLFLRIFLEGITQSHWAMEPIVFPLVLYAITGKAVYAGIIFALMGAVSMLTLPWIGRLIDKTNSLFGLKITFVLYVLAFSFLFIAKDVYLFAVGAIILSLGKSFNGPAFSRIETEKIASKKRAEYLFYFNAYDTLTGAIAALLVGFVLDYFSAQGVFLLYAVFTGVGAIGAFMIFRKKISQESYAKN